MYEISFSAGMTATVLGWILFRAAAYRKSHIFDLKYEIKQLFFLVNLLVILRFTFYPFFRVNGQVQPLLFEPDRVFPLRVNLVPMVNILRFATMEDLILNLMGNFAMFIPTGILTPLIYKRIHTFGKVTLTGFLLSLIIEILQLPFAVRATDVDDLILNTAGCMVGYGIYALGRYLIQKTKKHL